MPDTRGHIELERTIDSITVGIRHRKELGDIDALARSIEEVGLLQPITVTPDGVLVCGKRRLEAVRRLGWSTLKVWVRSGISDELSQVLAQQDENEQRKPFTQLELSHLYDEVKRLTDEEAAHRQAATRFGADGDSGGVNGAAGSTGPRGSGDSRVQAALLLTGTRSYSRLEQVGWIERVSKDPERPATVRQYARNMLTEIEKGGPVEPAYKRVKAADELARKPDPQQSTEQQELTRLAAEALERVRQRDARKGMRGLKRKPTEPRYRSLRSFILTWTELDGWSQLYDVKALAEQLTDDEVALFARVVAETNDFADRLRETRHALASA
ncbi:ParB N-terminal domain-containing protein [Nocardioides sp.]|uniref:ParB N-terminal domain-containing protein n=1 Tax=Nocardioides sp. TaxID=35761 RepID=UPI002B87B7FB|nr:ParB N-terminal domain-containing protein [Nocardioides sp.]HXH78394.1 ParB N-terminal domain-containing protein [Nocardioides sp.]